MQRHKSRVARFLIQIKNIFFWTALTAVPAREPPGYFKSRNIHICLEGSEACSNGAACLLLIDNLEGGEKHN
jgi:hypothetical protein